MAALGVSMSIAPGNPNPIFPGDITAFRITLTNSNSGAAVTGVTFTDALPSGLKVAGTGLAAYACVSGDGSSFATTGAVAAVVGSGAISLTGGTVPQAMPSGASGRCDIDVQVTSTVGGSSQLNTIAVGAVTGNDGAAQSNTTQAQQSVTVNSLNAPAISKSFSSSTVLKSDQTVKLTIVISNASNLAKNLPLNGGGDTPAFGLRDTLPSGLQVAAAPNALASCTGTGVAPSFTPAAGDTALLAVGGTIAAGGSCAISVDLVGVTNAGGASTALVNTINGGTDFANRRGLTAANASASLTVKSILQVTTAFSPTTVAAGQQSTLRVTLTNASLVSTITLAADFDDAIDQFGSPAFGLKVTGTPTLGAGCTGAAAVSTLAGNFGVRLAVGTSIAASSSCVITIPYTGTLQNAGAPQTFTNSIVQGAVQVTDASVISPLAASTVTVVDQLTVAKSVSPSSVAPGNPVRYTVTVNNFTGGALSNVAITDTLPSGVTLLPTTPTPPTLSGAGCSGLTVGGTSTIPVFTIGTMPAGAGASPGVCSVVFWAMTPQNAAPGLVLTNAIGAGGVVATGGATNAGGSGNANSTVANVITLGKAFNPAAAFEGTVSTLTITLTNISAAPISGLNFSDPLPVGSTGQPLMITTPAAASTTCAGSTLTATPGASSFTLTGGSIPARASNGTGANGSCTITLSVIGAAGAYVNTLPAAALTGAETYADNSTHTAASPGPVTASLTYNSALTAAKSFVPATISAGGLSTVTILLGNVGTGTLNNVGVVDPLPANLVVANPASVQTTCGGSPAVTATPGASSASLTGAVIPGSGQCNFLFNVTGAGGANWVNTIPAGNVTAAGGVRNVSSVTATLTNSTAGSVNITNNTSPNSLVSPGQVSVLTLTITNGGAVNLSGLAVTDYFTSDGAAGGALTGMVVSGQPSAATTCAGGVVSAAAGGTSVSLTGVSLAQGSSCTVTINVTLTVIGTVQNRIPVGAISNSQGVSNTLATTTSLSAGANIGVTKRFAPAVVRPGVRSRLQITFINPVSLAVSNLSATDNLPAGLVVPAGPNPTTTCTGATVSAPTATQVTVTGASLPPASGGVSSICVAEIDVVAAAAGTYNNVIAIGGVNATVSGGPVSNPAPAPATLEVRSPATIAKLFNPNAVGLGVSSTLTITIGNPNTVPLTGAALSDALPANVSVALTPNASTTCAGGTVTATPSATSVLLTGGTIPASGSCTVTLDVLSNVAGVYLNTIPAGALGTIQGVTNENPASDTLRIINPPTVGKQFNPTSIPSGGTSALTIVLGNTNNAPATLTSSFIDTLPTSPAPIVVATPNGLTGTCTLASVTAAAGSGTVTYGSGATIPAGGCTIVVNVTGTTNGVYTNLIPIGALQTSFGNNLQPANADLTISPLGFISGTVFRDNNVIPNGLLDLSVDAPIAGITITLTGTDFGANGVAGGGDDMAVNRNTITDALGNYAFTALNPGSYTVTEPSQPAGTQNGITTAGAVTGGGGGTAGSATGVGATPSVIGTIMLLKNGGGAVAASPGNNFAEVAPSSISGQVFLDQDDNGIRNAADTALAGVSVQLLNNVQVVVASTLTDNNGAYVFTGLAPGVYTIREPTQPTGTANGKTISGTVANGGTAGTPTAQNVVPSQIATLTLPPGTDTTANNFAEVPAGRQIGGRVFADGNADGVFNGGDQPLSGVTLNLTGTDFNGLPVTATTTTTSDGRYVFTGLAAGTYTVTEPSQPGGTSNGITTAGSTGGLATLVAVTPSAISSIDLSGTNSISSNNDFAELALPPAPPPPTASVAGRVYTDLNNNGIVDPGETGIAGVTVTLTGVSSTGVVQNAAATTGADGAYVFNGLPASNPSGYTLTETQPANVNDGKTTIAGGGPGSATSTKPVTTGGPDIIIGVVTPVGGQLTGYNFGEIPPGGSVSGNVYIDLNDNGVKDAGEAGIGGVAVRLSGVDATGAAIDRSLTTASDGSYAFAGIPASGVSGYTINETQPAVYLDGKTTILSGNPGTATSTKPVANAGGDVVSGITVRIGDNLRNYDFGEKADGAISGFVYRDANDNGVREPGEAPLPGVTVRLTGVDANGAAVDRTLVTGGDGAYAFGGLMASGSAGYVITETQPANFTDGKTTIQSGNPGVLAGGKPLAEGASDVITGVVLPVRGQFTDYNFGELRTGSAVTGYVYIDGNNNGVRDPGEAAIAGVTVRITGLEVTGTPVALTRVTGADGAFRFDVPASGASGYAIIETQPSGFTDGRTSIAAGAPGSATTPKPVGVGNNDQINGVVVPAGVTLTDYRFGEIAIPQLRPPIINGYVYLDRDHTRIRPTDGRMAGQAGWTVVLRQNGTPICTTTTDVNGFYQFDNLHCPGYEVSGLPIGSGFAITFSKDGNSLPNVPTSGGNRGIVPTSGGQILNITLTSADQVVEQNLPLDPAGVVYDSVTRQPVAGAMVTIRGPSGFDPATQLVGGTPAMVQTVGTDGLYQFLLQNNFPSGTYTLTVTAPTAYLPAPSTGLPPCASTLNVGLNPNPALIQASDFAPGGSVTPQTNPATCPGLIPGGSSTTQYFLSFVITNGGSAPILNNHIPLDRILTGGALMVTKTTPLVTASRGGLVPYTITATNTLPVPLVGVRVRDQLPPGFQYRQGTATRNGVKVSPTVVKGVVTWPAETFAPKQRNTYTLLLVVGAGVGEGDYVNRALVAGSGDAAVSNVATATVRIAPDPTLDCPDIIGKVFDDRNANGYQDEGEPGIPGVRMATPNGLLITSDAEGRFHVPCPAIPNPDRGSNFVMKLDERSLPSGFRVTTENPRDVRITRGKLVKLNFGATVHRVVRVELAPAAFAAGQVDLLPAWRTKLDELQATLKARPSIVRIAYAAGDDPPDLARRRAHEVRRLIEAAWKQMKGQYSLVVEIEVQP